MTKPRPIEECRRFERWLTPYMDGELDAVHIIEVEEHLEECEACREYVSLGRAMRSSLRCAARAKAPNALRERLIASIAAEHEAAESEANGAVPAVARSGRAKSSDAPHAMPARKPRLIKMRYVFPLAAAAMLVLVLGAVQYREAASAGGVKPESIKSGLPAPPYPTAATMAALDLDQLVDDLVAQHAEPLPPETTDPAGLEKFDRYVGVRVATPKFEGFDARYLGARVHPVRSERGKRSARTAMLQYMLRNRHRVTIYVFDPQRVPMRAKHLTRRDVGKQKIYVGNLRGYSVAASAHRGIGYALASDLPDDQSAELVRVAAR